MNALGDGNGSMALKEAQLVLFPSHTGYLTPVLFAITFYQPHPLWLRLTRIARDYRFEREEHGGGISDLYGLVERSRHRPFEIQRR